MCVTHRRRSRFLFLKYFLLVMLLLNLADMIVARNYIPENSTVAYSEPNLPFILSSGDFYEDDIGGWVHMNKLHLRSHEVKEASCRILMLGASDIYGYMLHDEETLSARLEVILTERARKQFNEKASVDVYNGAVPSYSSLDGRFWAQKLIPALKPDVLILGTFAGDDLSDYRTDAQKLGTKADILVREALGKCALWRCGRDLLNRLKKRELDDGGELPNLPGSRAGRAKVLRVSGSETLENYAGILATARRQGVESVYYLLFPNQQYRSLGFPLPAGASAQKQRSWQGFEPLQGDRETKERLVRYDLCYAFLPDMVTIDLYSQWGRKQRLDSDLFVDESHLTKLGTQMAAEEISAFLWDDPLFVSLLREKMSASAKN